MIKNRKNRNDPPKKIGKNAPKNRKNIGILLDGNHAKQQTLA